MFEAMLNNNNENNNTTIKLIALFFSIQENLTWMSFKCFIEELSCSNMQKLIGENKRSKIF